MQFIGQTHRAMSRGTAAESETASKQGRPLWPPLQFGVFIYDVCWTVALGAVAWAYWRFDGVRAFFPAPISRVPIAALWFGALGGIVISLKGVYDHRDDWNDKMGLWHFGRPISGAVVGGIVYLLLVALSKDQGPAAPIVYAAAFVLATQERRFFNFMYEVARLLVQVPGADLGEDFALREIQPKAGAAGKNVIVRGVGFDPMAEVSLGGVKLENVERTTDGSSIAGTIPMGTPAMGKVDVVVTNPNGVARVLLGGFTLG